MVIPALFAKLATALLADYATQIVAGKLPSADDLATSLKSFVTGGVLKIDDIFNGDFSNITSSMLDRVKDQIASFKGKLGLPANGFLEQETLEAVKNRCLREIMTRKAPTLNTPVGGGAPSHDFRYFLDFAPFNIEGKPAATIIQDAWNDWQKVANIAVDNVDAPENGNVVINFTKIDGNGSVLADATVGEGRGVFFRMVMRIDRDEDWTATKFKGVVTHEIGHMLGLHHTEVPRSLMNPLYQSDINEPRADDIGRITQIWGVSGGVIHPDEIIPLPPGI